MTYPGRVSPERAVAALNDLTELLDLWHAQRTMQMARRVSEEMGEIALDERAQPLREAGITLDRGRLLLQRTPPHRERSRSRTLSMPRRGEP